ncbi:MAG: beta-mannosidase [Frankiaceae bacterium]|nr:beta-mannosidase [Frankiaceae bacterium]
MDAPDLLAGAEWECASTPPGTALSPAELPPDLPWLPARIPGTAAAALLAAGRWSPGDDVDFDAADWWFRCRIPAAETATSQWLLRVGGIATLADVWVGDDHVLESRSMFVASEVAIAAPGTATQIVIRCRSLRVALEARAPRPRWKTRLVDTQSMRWFRTSLVGRMPGWAELAAAVGPWRALSLVPAPPVALDDVRLSVTCDGAGGTVRVRARVRSASRPTSAVLVVGSVRAALDVVTKVERAYDDSVYVEGAVTLATVDRWWPRGYGPQPLYDVSLDIDGEVFSLRRVGFRDLTVDRTDGAFTISVNGVTIFCRGACWVPVDAVGLAPGADAQRNALAQVAAAGMNMVRVTGTMVYEDETFWDSCDELGLLVWQDVMCADMDYPDAPEFVELVTTELAQVFGRLQGRPSLAVVSGGSETEQQATMLGLPPDRRTSALATESVPALLADWLPGTAYVTSSPTGGPLAIRNDAGVAHYFGVGGYRRPLSDVRAAGVRFAAECLAFATPPERESVDADCGGAAGMNEARWKAGVPHDNGSSWDFEDVRDHYVRELFAVEPADVRLTDPERALDLGRAAVAEVAATVFAEWRRAASPCAGGLVLAMRDLRAGAGVGLVDARGVPKAPFYALARVNAPVALFAVDEALNGLRLHIANDGPDPLLGTLRVTLYAPGGARTNHADRVVAVPARGVAEFDAEDILGGFRDLTWAYRFGPAATDVVHAEFVTGDGQVVVHVAHFVLGPTRPVTDIGLSATLERAGAAWDLVVTTELAAQYVSIDAPGFALSDSWFHLVPGGSHRVRLSARDACQVAPPQGYVRALNGAAAAPIG